MTTEDFKNGLKYVNFVDIGNYTFYPDTMELFNRNTRETSNIKSLDKLFEMKLDEKKVLDIITDDNYKFLIDID